MPEQPLSKPVSLGRVPGVHRRRADAATGTGRVAQSREPRRGRELIKPNDRLTSFDRLEIYNQQYWWRISGAFAEDFRGLRAVFGERKFEKLSTAYLSECGSHSWTLRDLGSRLLDFIADHPELIAPHCRLASDMAAVEWARVVAFDGEEKPPLDAVKFSKRPPEKMTLGIQPYLNLLELHYPVDHMLRRLKRAESGTASNAMSGGVRARRVRLTSKAATELIHLAVHRSDFSVYYKRLDAEAFHLLSALRDGRPLEAACEMAFSESLGSPEAISEKVRLWFSAWMSFGWLTA